MSSTRGINSPARRPGEFYETPSWATRAILRLLQDHLAPQAILEPGAGSGAITRELRATWPQARITALEIDPAHREELELITPCVKIGDFFELVPLKGAYHLVVMNPPYSGPKREDLVMWWTKRAIFHAGYHGAVAVLTRLNWLGSQKRAQWLREQIPFVGVLPKRPSFTGDGKTDSCEYCWLVYNVRELMGRWAVLEVEG